MGHQEKMKNVIRITVNDLGGVSVKKYTQTTGESTAKLIMEVMKIKRKSKINLN